MDKDYFQFEQLPSTKDDKGPKKESEQPETCFGRFYALGIRGRGFIYCVNGEYYTFGNENAAPDTADLIVDNTAKGIMRKARRIVNRCKINSAFADFKTWMEKGLYIAVLEGILTENGDEYGRYMVTNDLGLLDFD